MEAEGSANDQWPSCRLMAKKVCNGIFLHSALKPLCWGKKDIGQEAPLNFKGYPKHYRLWFRNLQAAHVSGAKNTN